MLSTAPDARILRSRAALQRALIVLSEEEAFDTITVRAIAAKAGVGYATFFRHYADKDALLADVAALLTTDLLQLIQPLFGRGDSLAAARSLVEFVAEHRSLHQALLAGGAGEGVRSWLVPQIMGKLDEARRGRPDTALMRMIRNHSVAACLNLIANWLRQSEPMTTAELADLINRLVLLPAIAVLKTHLEA
jgi:AcrR family transcriptional regulator